MTLSQQDRMMRIATPLGEDTLVVLSFDGTEEMSRLFRFELVLASEKNDITFGQLAGQNATLGLRSFDGAERYFNGIISEFSPVEISTKEGFSKYRAVMLPSAWLLTECYDCRIFQKKSVPDIIEEVLSPEREKSISSKIDFRMDLDANYAERQYCVQYNESDLDFIDRLCADEGIFYYFEHENGKHVLVFGDSARSHKPFAKGTKERVHCLGALGAHTETECLFGLQPVNRVRSAKYTARDYNFKKPNEDMTVKATSQKSGKSQGEIYEYPGGYTTGEDEGTALAKLRMQAHDARVGILKGESNCRGFCPGYTFTLAEHPIGRLNQKGYLLTKVYHRAAQEFGTDALDGDIYRNQVTCIIHDVKTPFRPWSRTPKPVIAGSQTAIVTGPSGEEIHTDEFGRVKVRFHWDRRKEGIEEGNTSCWVRVSQNWAGARWGGMNIPRVGQEVIVNFLDGDPDRPIITGRVYHGQNKPPYDLPADKTKSTIKSNSTKNGEGGYNEIRFEDLKGSEEFYTHAARDQNEVVENDMRTDVKRRQAITVEENRSVTVARGNETIAIAEGSREVSVKSNEKHLNAANFEQKVSGDFTLKVNGNIRIDASGVVTISGAKIILNG